jgi:tRNA uridine 5-carboxymethylaminomethyl modification enzyme
LHAGINAALAVRGDGPWVPRRDQAYLGVLVDDWSARASPSRTGCSRAARSTACICAKTTPDVRLTELGRRIGVVPTRAGKHLQRKQERVSRETARLRATRVGPAPARDGLPELSRDYALFDLLRRPGSVRRADPWQDDQDGVSRETLRAELGRTLADR